MITYWPDEIINKIRSLIIKDVIGRNTVKYRELFKGVIGGNNEMEQDYLWAYQMAISRHIVFPVDVQDVYYVCPVIDLLNHSFEPNAVIVPNVEFKEKCFEVSSIKDIKKHEQILVSYGDLGNIDLIERYGFVVEDNKHSHIPFVFGNISKYDAIMEECYKDKVTLISNKLNCPLNKTLGGEIYRNRMEKQIIPKIRGWMLTKDDINRMGNDIDLMNKINEKNEELALGFFKSMVKQRLDLLVNVDYTKELNMRKDERYKSLQNFNEYNLLLLEAEEKLILENVWNFIKKTMM